MKKTKCRKCKGFGRVDKENSIWICDLCQGVGQKEISIKNTLNLNLKGEYFDAIKLGTKPFEYRLKNNYWTKRLVGRDYDLVSFKRGYPRGDDLDKIITVPYRGYEIQKITHSHFGDDEVEVFAIYTN